MIEQSLMNELRLAHAALEAVSCSYLSSGVIDQIRLIPKWKRNVRHVHSVSVWYISQTDVMERIHIPKYDMRFPHASSAWLALNLNVMDAQRMYRRSFSLWTCFRLRRLNLTPKPQNNVAWTHSCRGDEEDTNNVEPVMNMKMSPITRANYPSTCVRRSASG